MNRWNDDRNGKIEKERKKEGKKERKERKKEGKRKRRWVIE